MIYYFKNPDDEVLIFRKDDNYRRLNKSAKRLFIPQIPEDIFMEGLDKLIELDSDWCKKGDEYSLYIRPFIFASGECIKASSSDEFTFMIICSPSIRYYNDEEKVVREKAYALEEKYTGEKSYFQKGVVGVSGVYAVVRGLSADRKLLKAVWGISLAAWVIHLDPLNEDTEEERSSNLQLAMAILPAGVDVCERVYRKYQMYVEEIQKREKREEERSRLQKEIEKGPPKIEDTGSAWLETGPPQKGHNQPAPTLDVRRRGLRRN